MKIKRSSRRLMFSYIMVIFLLVILACTVSSTAATPTYDPNLMKTFIAGTFVAAQIQTLTANPTLTLTLEPTSTVTLTPTSSFTPTLSFTETPPITPTPSPERIVDGYLTAIQTKNWDAAYDYLCRAIKLKVRSPEDMADRIFIEINRLSLPTSHQLLGSPNGFNFIQFKLRGLDWWSGEYEARVDETNWKICGIGVANGDLDYLLLRSEDPLDIYP